MPKGFGRALATQGTGPSQKTPAQTAAHCAKAVAAALTPPVGREPKIESEAETALKTARALVVSWERMTRDHPDLPSAADGLANAIEALRLAKLTIESGRSHTDRLQTAVTRQSQAVKEHNPGPIPITSGLWKRLMPPQSGLPLLSQCLPKLTWL